MPKTTQKSLTFPLAGVIRREGYRKQSRPYSAPWAVNVRGVDPLEARDRGGSRPGLVQVAGVTTAMTGSWEWPNGESIEWNDSDGDVEYALAEDAITAPDGTSIIDPASIIAVSGDAPSGCTVNCIYRDRVILASGDAWYASRIGDSSDWEYGADMNDASRAVVGTVALAGRDPSAITALVPHRDKALLIATSNSLHLLNGDPATGSISVVDENIGIIAPYAWAFNGELFVFLSNDGVYVGGIGSRPQRFSEGRIPGELKNVDVNNNTVLMAYDPGARGFHLFITPASGRGSHYFLDLEHKAVWPVVFGNNGHQPVVVARIQGDSMERIVFKGVDGTWREFDSSAGDDDGTDLESHVLLGPVRIAPNDVRDAVLAEIHGIMGDLPSTVTWRVVLGDSAETATDTAVAAVLQEVASAPATGVDASGSWSGGRNHVYHPRVRGAWLVIWISSKDRWSYEAVAITARQLGRIR